MISKRSTAPMLNASAYDFGGSTDTTPGTGIENAFISYNGFRPVAIDLGYLDVPFTLDEATSSNDIMFLERAEVKNVGTNLAADDFRAALGVRSNDDRYWAGVYLTGPQSGAPHSGSNSQQLGGAARFTYQLLQSSNYSLHAGLDGEYVFRPRSNGAGGSISGSTVSFSDRPELRVDPTAFLIRARSRRITPALTAASSQAAGTASSSRASTIAFSLIRRGFQPLRPPPSSPSTAATSRRVGP